MDTNMVNGMQTGLVVHDSTVSYVAVRAKSNSAWDDADYAIIRVDPELRRVLQVATGVVALASARLPLSGMILYAGTCSFHVWDDSEQGGGERIRRSFEDPDVEMVDFDTVDFLGLSTTEQELSGGEMVMSQHGVVRFRTWAKHTGEEYWTEGIHFGRLLARRQAANGPNQIQGT